MLVAAVYAVSVPIVVIAVIGAVSRRRRARRWAVDVFGPEYADVRDALARVHEEVVRG